MENRRARSLDVLKTEYRGYQEHGISQNGIQDTIIKCRSLRNVNPQSELAKKVSGLLNLRNDQIQQEIEGLFLFLYPYSIYITDRLEGNGSPPIALSSYSDFAFVLCCLYISFPLFLTPRKKERIIDCLLYVKMCNNRG